MLIHTCSKLCDMLIYTCSKLCDMLIHTYSKLWLQVFSAFVQALLVADSVACSVTGEATAQIELSLGSTTVENVPLTAPLVIQGQSPKINVQSPKINVQSPKINALVPSVSTCTLFHF
jgi:hypothetical protein